jgi:hypothetical protein
MELQNRYLNGQNATSDYFYALGYEGLETVISLNDPEHKAAYEQGRRDREIDAACWHLHVQKDIDTYDSSTFYVCLDCGSESWLNPDDA